VQSNLYRKLFNKGLVKLKARKLRTPKGSMREETPYGELG